MRERLIPCFVVVYKGLLIDFRGYNARKSEGKCIIVAYLPQSDLVKINNCASVLI